MNDLQPVKVMKIEIIKIVDITFFNRSSPPLCPVFIIVVFSPNCNINVQVFICFSLAFAFVAWLAHGAYKKRLNYREKIDSIPSFSFAAVCFLIVISTIINKTESSLLFGYSQRGEGLIHLLLYFIVFYHCGSKIKNQLIKKVLVIVYLLISFLIGILTLVDYFIVRIKIFVNGYFIAIFYHENFYAYFLTIAITLSAALLVLDEKRVTKVFALFTFIINTVVLAFNDSFGGFLACLVSLAFLIVAASIKNHRFSVPATAMLVLFLAVCFIVGLKYQSFFSEVIKLGSDVEKIATNAEDADSAGTFRWGLWRATAGYIKERPLFGYGFEGTADLLLSDTGQDKVHNEYLDYMVDFGIPAGLIYIGGLISIFIKALKRRDYVDNITLCCLVASLGYIGSAFFGNRLIFITPFFFIFLGLANNTHGQYAKLAPDGETQTEETAENGEAVTPAADELTEKAEEAETEIVAESIVNTGIGETDDV